MYKLGQRQSGFTVVELMVAMVIGVLLASGILQILVNSSQAYRIQNGILRAQENGQFAMEFLARDIRSTAFWGCMNAVDELNNLLDSDGSGYAAGIHEFNIPVEGTENASGSGDEIAGTDSITVRGARIVGGGLRVLEPYGPTRADPITVNPGNGFEVGDIAIVSDCQAGDIFQVTNDADASGQIAHETGSTSPGNSSPNLSKVYDDTAAVYAPYTHTYSIRNGSNGLPSLFRSDVSGDTELVEGIENMIVLYGEDTNGNGTPNRYVRAGSVGDMNNVVSVRINILAQTLEDNLVASPQEYRFNNQNITPADNRLRRAYSTTITLRNRVNQ
ncbi:MAG: pilus assembly protein PilW [Legionellales bacterium]|nr:pilus assembly protein PilW [Legionellales bacterium]|tara:strand:- start:15096 stop:16088 length:993 start_codon:yes stop_codon:yes gene_type:complete